MFAYFNGIIQISNVMEQRNLTKARKYCYYNRVPGRYLNLGLIEKKKQHCNLKAPLAVTVANLDFHFCAVSCKST